MALAFRNGGEMDENNTGYDTYQNQGADVPQNADNYQNDNGYQNNGNQYNGYQNNVYNTANAYNGYNNEYAGNGYQNYNNYNGYQPYQQLNQYNASQLELEEPVKLGEWILALVLMCIPCVNIIMAFVLAFSKTEKKSKSNFYKAYLIVYAVSLVLVVLFWFAIAFIAML